MLLKKQATQSQGECSAVPIKLETTWRKLVDCRILLIYSWEKAADTLSIRCLYLLLRHAIKTVRNAQDEYDASREQEIEVMFIEKHQVMRSLNVDL